MTRMRKSEGRERGAEEKAIWGKMMRMKERADERTIEKYR